MKSRPSFLSTAIVSCLATSSISGASSSRCRLLSFTLLNKSTAIPSRALSRSVGTKNHECTLESHAVYRSRRDVIRKIPLLIPLSTAVLVNPNLVNAASSDLFKPNPLTNPVLEKVMITSHPCLFCFHCKNNLYSSLN
jgi:hypothetical protein